LRVVVAAEEDCHVETRVPIEDLADFVPSTPGRMAKFFGHARLLSHEA
jgi:hypothetical protein